MIPFFGEGGIDPFAKPRLLLSPAETFLREDLIDSASLDRQTLPLVEIGP